MKTVVFRPRALRGIESTVLARKKIINLIEVIQSGQFPPHTKKLKGVAYGYRVQVGRWRVLFVVHDDQIEVVDIFLRKESSDYRRRV